MPRIVEKKDDVKIQEAAESCPVNCFRKNNNEYVIDPDLCIDCGVCQTIVDEGVILDDVSASQESIEFNREKSKEWEPAL